MYSTEKVFHILILLFLNSIGSYKIKFQVYACYIKLLHKLQTCIFKYNLRVRSTYAQIARNARDFH